MPRASTVHAVIAIGIDMGKNTLHMVGLDSCGAIVCSDAGAARRERARPRSLLRPIRWPQQNDSPTRFVQPLQKGRETLLSFHIIRGEIH